MLNHGDIDQITSMSMSPGQYAHGFFYFYCMSANLCFSPCLIAVLLIGACSAEPATIRISGKVDGLKSDHVVLCRSKERVSYNAWMTTIDTAVVSDEGEFSFVANASEADFYQVTDMRGYPVFVDLYLEPGDTIAVTVSKASGTRKTNITGARADAYKYYDLLDSARQNDKAFSVSYQDIATLPIDSAQILLDERVQKERLLLRSHFDGKPEWEPVASLAKDQRDSEVLAQYYAYLYYHNYYTNDTFLYLIPDPSYYGFLDSIDLTYSPKYYTWQHPYFVVRFLEDKIKQDYPDIVDSVYWEDKLSLMFESAKKYYAGGARDAALLALTDEFSRAISSEKGFDRIAEIKNYFIENHTSEELLKKFQYVCAQYEVLTPGNIVPDLALPDINGDTIRFSDMRGKVLYVDFWGTWCYPCLKELPSSLELHETFAGENVEFVFIGLESEGEQVDEWKAFIQGEKSFSYAPFLEQRVYPGVHLLAEGQFGNRELKPFKISSAPTYMLIDASGRIVTSRASRPSNSETEGAIRKALKTL
jgi:thiol-disulfide isomerase/thioredoxin